MVLVQNLARVFEIEVVLRRALPREHKKPVDVIADDCRLGAHGGHHFKFAKFRFSFFTGLEAHTRGFDLFLEFFDLGLELVALTQFFLDRGHLFVEIVFFLPLLHLLANARADASFDLENLDLALENGEELLHARHGVYEFQKTLFVLGLDVEVRCNRVRQARGVVHALDGHQELGGNALVEFDVALKCFVQRAQEGFGLGAVVDVFEKLLDLHENVVFVIGELSHFRPLFAFDKNLEGAIGQLHKLNNRGQTANGIDILDSRLIVLAVSLGAQNDVHLVGHGRLERIDGFFTPHKKRHNHVGVNDDVPQREHGNNLVRCVCSLKRRIRFFTGFAFLGGASFVLSRHVSIVAEDGDAAQTAFLKKR